MRGLTAFQLAAVPRSLPAHALPPLPIEATDCKESATFDPLQRGAYINLCRAYWRSACTFSGLTDSQLMTLSECHTRRWQIVRAPVLKAFFAVQPALASVYARMSESTAARLAGAIKGGEESLRRRGGRFKLVDVQHDTAPSLPRKDPISVRKMSRGNAAMLTDAAE